jgi:hypothetical protein
MIGAKTLDEVSNQVAAEALDGAWLDGGRTFSDAFSDALDERDKWVRGEKKPLPVPWPEWGAIVAGVDEEKEADRGGLLPGLHVVAAGTGVGKTQFAVSIAAHALRAGALVAYFALELSEQEVAVRAFAETRGAPRWSKVLRGRDNEDRSTLEGLAAELTADEVRSRFAIFAKQADATLPAFVLAKAAIMRAKVNAEDSPFPPLLVFDYTQLAAMGSEADARKAVGELAAALREAARAHDLVVIAISSVARSNYGNAGKSGPETGGLTESGAIKNPEGLLIAKESGEMEYCSNTSTVIVNVERLESGRTLAALCVAKNREGLTRWAPAAFEAGRWLAPSRDGKNAPERAQVAAYFAKGDGDEARARTPKVEINVASMAATKARKTFEAAWWASGANLRDGAPFVSHEAWKATSEEKRENPEEIDNLGPQGSSQVWPVEGGWTAMGGWGAELLSKQSAGSAKPDEKRSKPTGRAAPKPKRG